MLKVVRDYTGARRDDRRALHVAEASAIDFEPEPQPPEHQSGSPSPQRRPPDPWVEVTPAGMLDLARVRRLDRVHRLNQPESALSRSRSFSSPLAMRRSDLRPIVLVGRAKQGIVGFADFRPALPDLRWQLAAIGASSDAGDPQTLWTGILEEGTRRAGAAGVKRLYARAPHETLIGDALRDAGYSAYASELVFIADSPASITTGIDARDQERADTWAVHQLYNTSVPKEVLYAEAYTSHRWELPGSRMTLGKETRAWICERNHTPIAYVRCTSLKHRHVLDVIFAPGHLDEMARLLDEVIRRLDRQGPISELYCSVRSYSLELDQMLIDRNFRPWLQQELMVRYTTAPIRVMSTETGFSESDAGERVPRRVPVYYSGTDNREPQDTLHVFPDPRSIRQRHRSTPAILGTE